MESDRSICPCCGQDTPAVFASGYSRLVCMTLVRLDALLGRLAEQKPCGATDVEQLCRVAETLARVASRVLD